MSLHLIALTPALAALIWAITVKIKSRQYSEIWIISALAFCTFVNAMMVYSMITEDVSVGTHMVQMAAGSSIIPIIYTFFSRQAGRSQTNAITILLWGLALLSFVPQILIYNPFKPFAYPDFQPEPFAIIIIRNGKAAGGMYTGDLIIILQAILTMMRVVPFMRKMHRNRLRLNPKVYAFVIWWMLTITASIMMSSMTYDDLRSPVGECFYFITYSLLSTAISVLIALRFDLSTILDEKGETVNDINVYVQQQYGAMAAQLKELIEGQKMFLEPHCTSEEVVKQLHTNRTYFSQMMSAEIGMTFPEYLNSLRISHAEDLLRNTDLTIADVASQCGYSDSGYLGRKFKEKHGMTPSEWRKQMGR